MPIVRIVACAVLALALTVSFSHGGSAASSGPVAAYGFDEGTGTTLTDLSGHGNAGSIKNGTWTTAGKYGGALSFNGSSTRVVVPDSASLDLTGPLTLEAWVRPTSLSDWRAVAVKEQPGELVYALYANSKSSLPDGIVYTGGAERNAYGTAKLPTSTWSHIAGVYDGSKLTFYVNGQAVSSSSVSGSLPVSSGAFSIGGDSVWGEWFSGQIDELRVYDRALSGSEISTDMQTPVGGATPPPPPPPADTTAPTAPANLAVSGSSQTSVSLGWSASTDDVGVAGYGVYRDGSTVASTSSLSATVSGLACGTTYSFAVDAYDAAGNRSAKSSVSGTTAACSSSGGGGGSTATVFVSPSGSDSNACTQTAPCKSFNRAYAVAKPGQTVEVAGGTYGSQTLLKGSQSQSGPMITFACASGATCTIGSLTLGQNNGSLSGDAPSWLTFDGINISGGSLYTYLNVNTDHPGNLVFQNGQISCFRGCGGLVKTNSYSNVTLRNTTLGPACCNGDALEIGLPRSGAPTPSNYLLDNVTIRDIYDSCKFFPSALGSCSGTGYEDGCSSCDHVDGIQAYGVNGFTMRNSRMYAINPGGTVGQGLFMQSANGGVFSDILVQNTFFDRTPNNNVSFSGPGTGTFDGYLHLYYNTIRKNLRLYGDSSNRVFKPTAKVVVAGNIIEDLSSSLNNSCQIQASDGSLLPVVYSHNLVANQTCGSTDIKGTATFVSTDAHNPDLHLTTAATNAIDKGESTYCPASDYDGQSRPLGAACDIGADEIK